MENPVKLRKGTLYVVRCHTKVSGKKVGLGLSNQYEVGDFVTYDGDPTKNINEAQLYKVGARQQEYNEFPWEDDFTSYTMEDYFEAFPVRIVPFHSDKKERKR